MTKLPYYEEKNGYGGKLLHDLVIDMVEKNAVQ